MLRLVARRAAVQGPLLAAVVAVVVTGATLLGVCALLLTASQERALEAGISRAPADDVAVTAFATGIRGADAPGVAGDTRAVLTGTLARFHVTTETRASSAMRALSAAEPVPPRRLAYLSGIDGLAGRARLTAGRWPRAAGPAAAGRGAAPLEAVVLEGTASRLGLAPGDRVRLGDEVRPDTAGAVSLVVVGVARPLPGAGWDRDPLSGAGYDPAYNDGRFQAGVPAYGPFVVDLGDLLAGGSTLARLQVTAHPDLSAPSGPALAALRRAVPGVDARLAARLGDRVAIERVESRLAATLEVAHAQQAVTRATVLVVALLGSVLAGAALALAGRLVATLRAAESGLLATLGASRRQLVAAAAVEAAGLAGVAALAAVPLSLLVHALLTRRPALAAAGLAGPPAVTGAQVAAVTLGAVVLAAVLVVPALRPDPARAAPARGRRELLARSGADLALLTLAAAGWWQLSAVPAGGTGARTDAVRVVAPALCLLAGAALAPRLVVPPLRLADRLARRSRGLVLPLAALEAARRPQAAAAALLVALAAAAGTFGLALGATWDRSQQDQAAARVGTDLAVTLTGPARPGDGAALAAATGGAVSPATDRGVAVGQWLGGAGDPPRLVAVDAARAGVLLRGRPPDGASWAGVGAALAPRAPVTAPALAAGATPTLTGTTGPGEPRVFVAPRLVLQDGAGLRTPCDAAPVPLDGRPHPLPTCGPAAGERHVVALGLRVAADPAGGPAITDRSQIAVTLTVPGAAGPGAAGPWSVSPTGVAPQQVADARAGPAATTPGGTAVRLTAAVRLTDPATPAELVATAFEPPGPVPVAVSRRVSDVLRAPVGARLALTVGTTPVPVVVAAVVPTVPSAPGAAALLADVDLLSRALLTAGELAPPADAWWVGGPRRPDAAARAAALGLGEVTGREATAEQLAHGPLRAGLPAALTLLVPGAVLLLLAGVLLHVTSDVEARALEVARLRGLGLSRRSVLGGLLAQHGALLALLLVAGAAVGALASRAVAPLLVTSDVGGAPVPAVLARWPWAAEGALLALLVAGCAGAVALVVAIQVRRADAAHLRVGP